MIVTKTIAPPNSILFVIDPATGEIPESMAGADIASTSSCVVVGTLCEVDGETMVVFSDEEATRASTSDLQRVYRGVLATARRELHLCTVPLESVARLSVPTLATPVQVWTNNERQPDRVVILVGSAAS